VEEQRGEADQMINIHKKWPKCHDYRAVLNSIKVAVLSRGISNRKAVTDIIAAMAVVRKYGRPIQLPPSAKPYPTGVEKSNNDCSRVYLRRSADWLAEWGSWE
jgi:hypothetical protein